MTSSGFVIEVFSASVLLGEVAAIDFIGDVVDSAACDVSTNLVFSLSNSVISALVDIILAIVVGTILDIAVATFFAVSVVSMAVVDSYVEATVDDGHAYFQIFTLSKFKRHVNSCNKNMHNSMVVVLGDVTSVGTLKISGKGGMTVVEV